MTIATRVKLTAAALPLGLLAPAAPAQAADPEAAVSLARDARLIARGAAVQVVANYTLPTDKQFKYVSVTVTQAAAGRLATGSGGTANVVNDGNPHTITITVTAQGNRAFRKGPAYAQASAYAANDYDPAPATADTARTIRLR